jgi:hypothetical protein
LQVRAPEQDFVLANLCFLLRLVLVFIFLLIRPRALVSFSVSARSVFPGC